MAKALDLSQYIYLGRGEEVSGGRNKPSNLAGVLEAVIAAIFLDNGYREAKDFVLRLFDAELKDFTKKQVDIDYKSRLQQVIQSKHHETPIYCTTQTFGSSHNPMFTSEVSFGDILLGKGYGSSKKIAETEAARSALEQMD
jgi:ribonuclease-3